MRLAVIAGDGIGPEVVGEAVKVLDAVLPGVEKTSYDLGARRYHATGEVLPDSVLDELRAHDAILLGAIGDPSVPSGVLERGLLLRIRFALDHHINLRPARLYPGVTSPLAGNPDIDFVVVREGTEGPYTGTGGAIRVGTVNEVATEVSLNTAFGVRRVVHDAFKRAQQRRKQLTLVHKNNVLAYAGALWWRTVQELAAEYPDVEVAYQHVDSATIHIVTDPGRFDVIVTDNLFGDIITDLAAAVCGGIGLAASGNIDATRTNPSMFEPVHGSAPDIAGQGVADPTAAIMSVALLLSHVGEDDAAARVDKAVEQHLATRGDAELSTTQVGDRIVAGLSGRSVATSPTAVLAVRDRFDVVRDRHDAGAVRNRGCRAGQPVVFRRLLVLHDSGMDAVGVVRARASDRMALGGDAIRRDDPVQHASTGPRYGRHRRQAGATSGVGAGHDRVAGIPGERGARHRGGDAVVGLFELKSRDWQAEWINMIGCVAFGVSALGAFIGESGVTEDALLANVGTFIGTLCFLVAAVLVLASTEADERRTPPGPSVRARTPRCRGGVRNSLPVRQPRPCVREPWDRPSSPQTPPRCPTARS